MKNIMLYFMAVAILLFLSLTQVTIGESLTNLPTNVLSANHSATLTAKDYELRRNSINTTALPDQTTLFSLSNLDASKLETMKDFGIYTDKLFNAIVEGRINETDLTKNMVPQQIRFKHFSLELFCDQENFHYCIWKPFNLSGKSRRCLRNFRKKYRYYLAYNKEENTLPRIRYLNDELLYLFCSVGFQLEAQEKATAVVETQNACEYITIDELQRLFYSKVKKTQTSPALSNSFKSAKIPSKYFKLQPWGRHNNAECHTPSASQTNTKIAFFGIFLALMNGIGTLSLQS